MLVALGTKEFVLVTLNRSLVALIVVFKVDLTLRGAGIVLSLFRLGLLLALLYLSLIRAVG